MKKIGLFILGLSTIFFSGNLSQANDYEFTNLDITANILIDGTIDVKEDVTANFFVESHGIFKTIPLNYSVNGKNYHTNINNLKVDGKKWKTTKNNGKLTIKIGDPKIYEYGKTDYTISYSVYGLIRNFSGKGYAELYWNLIGNDNNTDIKKVSAIINLPKEYTGFKDSDFFITTDGKTNTVKQFQGTIDWTEGDKIIVTYDKGLLQKDGITLTVKFPNNYFKFDHKKQKKLTEQDSTRILRFLLILRILLVIFGPMLPLTKKIIEYFREHKKFPIIVQYEPPKGLNSAEVGILLHRYEDPKDIFSLVYKRAYEGIIKIQCGKNKSDFSLLKIKDIAGSYPKYEKKTFNILFQKNKLILNKKTHLRNLLINSGLEYYGIKKGRFTKKTIKGYNTGCLDYTLIILTFFLAPILSDIYLPLIIIPIIILLFMLFFSGKKLFFRGKKTWIKSKTLKETEKGAELISHILGYKQFLKSCDENKLRLFLQQDPLYFDKTLPYAIVFGLDTKLIKKIIPIIKEMNIKPTRYNGDINTFSKTTYKINNMSYIGYNVSRHSGKSSSSGGSSSGGSSSYSPSRGFSSGSAFESGGFSSGGGGGGGGRGRW